MTFFFFFFANYFFESYIMQTETHKKFDQRTIDLVTGYINEIHCDTNIEVDLFRSIPKLILRLCIGFHGFMDYFTSVSKRIMLSKDQLAITKIGSLCDVVYGNAVIASNQNRSYKWVIKINRAISLLCGITSYWNFFGSEYFWETSHPMYLYNGTGSKKSMGDWDPRYGQQFGTGDIIAIDLDLEKGHIRFSVNNIDQGIAYDNVIKNDNIQYKLLVCLTFTEDSIELIQFQQR
eukprot:437096_1